MARLHMLALFIYSYAILTFAWEAAKKCDDEHCISDEHKQILVVTRSDQSSC